MGFKKQSSGSVNYLKIKWLKKEEKEHYFTVNDEIINENVFEWLLIWAEKSSYEYEGKKKDTVKLLFQDDELYQLDIAYNSLWRSILNSLAWLETINNIELSLYINKWWYKSIWIKNNWVRTQWKYSIEEQQKLVWKLEKKDWSVEYDYYDFNQKLMWEIEWINNKVKNNKIEPKEDDTVEDDLPF
jgi:hypothetical protein